MVSELNGDPVWFSNPAPSSSPSFWDSLVSGHQLFRELETAYEEETLALGIYITALILSNFGFRKKTL